MKPKRTRRTKNSKDFLSNNDMLPELIKCQETGELTESMGKMITILSERYAKKPSFSGYTYVDEMISSAKVACCVGVFKFDLERGTNVFAYLTSCVHNAFLQVLNKEKDQQRSKDALRVKENLNPSFGYQEATSSEILRKQMDEDMDNSSFIKNDIDTTLNSEEN